MNKWCGTGSFKKWTLTFIRICLFVYVDESTHQKIWSWCKRANKYNISILAVANSIWNNTIFPYDARTKAYRKWKPSHHLESFDDFTLNIWLNKMTKERWHLCWNKPCIYFTYNWINCHLSVWQNSFAFYFSIK